MRWLALGVAFFVISLLFTELALRRSDPLRLAPSVGPSREVMHSYAAAFSSLPTAWFSENPSQSPPLPETAPQQIYQRAMNEPGFPENVLVWNRAYVEGDLFCQQRKFLRQHASSLAWTNVQAVQRMGDRLHPRQATEITPCGKYILLKIRRYRG